MQNRPAVPELKDVRHVHLIAVCGTGMGSLAGMLKARGLRVTGSDQNVYPPMSTQLLAQGVEIREGYKAENVADKPDLVIVGNAVSRDHPEVLAVGELGLPYLSFPEALAHCFIRDRVSIVVAGTHGKTTTTSMMAWVLENAGLSPGFMIGGMAKNFGHNGRAGEGETFVSEGDEYDSAYFDKEPKFLHYRPTIGILTSVEFDHGDIYKDLSVIVEKFAKYVALVPSSGTLIACTDYPAIRDLIPASKAPVVTYGFEGTPDWSAADMEADGHGGTRFTLVRQGVRGESVTMPMTGRHNVLNALSVLAAGERLGLSTAAVQAGFNSFDGITRRQDLVATVDGISIYDDFAHHPTAIAETIDAIRMRHPGQRIIGIFEPRSNTSRRKVFQTEFPGALAHADLTILAPVFNAAKLSDEERLDVPQVIADIRARGAEAESPGDVDAIVDWLTEHCVSGDVVLIMSNGGFGGIHGKLSTALAQRVASGSRASDGGRQ
jgi:UDP-N-acetylmuramate: L-alanyl-gamma-D-glutamyl-meso-diaminopimelate ligase